MHVPYIHTMHKPAIIVDLIFKYMTIRGYSLEYYCMSCLILCLSRSNRKLILSKFKPIEY